MKKLTILYAIMFLFGCQTTTEMTNNFDNSTAIDNTKSSQTPIVGGVETLYIHPFDISFQARMDTGAETSSIDAQNIQPFERDGEKWVSFDITNRKNNQTHHFEKPIIRKTNIIRTLQEEVRYVVHMSLQIANEIIDTEFTLNDRSKFEYQVLIGRNIINGRFIIDPSIENTLH
ncbi:MAG: hypothetical protein E7004_04140 [Alphaproteobacteria bacterium]|nr:hypothetical protein [Alphaproteobacteria bacterium]